MATATSKMTPDEIAQLVGAGPYTVVRTMDTAKGGQPTSCALCGSGLCKAIIFTNGVGREFSAGVDCARWIPGKRRAVASAKRDMVVAAKAGRKPKLPKLSPGIHWSDFDAILVSTNGSEYRATMDMGGRYPTLSIWIHPDRNTVLGKIERRGSMEEFESLILTWVEGENS